MTTKRRQRYFVAAVLAAASLMAACAGRVGTDDARRCSDGLDAAYKELDFAKANGFSGTVAWGKAASLLTAAETEKQFEKYPGCIDKVERARIYIRESRQ